MQGLTKLENREKYDVVSVSGLIAFRDDPEVYHQRYILKDNEPTKSMEFGTLVHMAILEPEKFNDEYISLPDKTAENDLSLEDLKEKCKELALPVSGTKKALADRIRTLIPEFEIYEDIIEQMAQSGKKLLPPEQFKSINAIVKKVYGHAKIGGWLKQSEKEKLGHWTHPSGLVMTFKADAFVQIQGVGICIDIKITRDWQEHRFIRSSFENGYHIQAASYMKALTDIVGYPVTEFMWIAIEPSAPHRVRFYSADIAMCEIGEKELDYYADEFLNAKRNNNFGPREIDLQIKPVSVSAWAFDNVKELL